MSASASKLVHVVGGGFNQIPLVEKAKAMGFRVLVTDMNEAPPARSLADHFERIDTTDQFNTLRCAERYRINYVLTDQTDVAVPTVAFVAESLGLPGIGYETALRFTNKYVMRKAMTGAGLGAHNPENQYFNRAELALVFCQGLERCYDYLVKPINSQGSKGVFVLSKRKGDLERLVYDAFRESQDRGVLVEKFIRGLEYSVETFVRDRKVHSLTLTKKYHYAHNPCLDERNTFLGDVAPELEQAMFSVNEMIIQGLGLEFGLTHAEYKIENGQVYLMEIAARGAGGSISSKIIPYLTDFDCTEALLNVVTGRPFEIKVNDYKRKFAVLKFCNFEPGRVKRVLVNERAIRDVLVFTLDIKEGMTLVRPRDSRDRPGYFVVYGTDRDAVLQKERAVEAAVQVEYGWN